MKFIVASLVALVLAPRSVASAYLRKPAQNDFANTLQGEILVEIDHANTSTISVECSKIMMDAFDTSYSQIYGVDGMTVAIEAEVIVPEGEVNRRKLASRSNWSYTFSWNCRFCSKYPLGMGFLSTDLRLAQETAILAIAKASACEAFHSATSVKISNIEQNEPAEITDSTTTAEADTAALDANEGEVMVKIDHASTTEISAECNQVMVNAFDTSYSQIYGVDGMTVAIEAQVVIPNADFSKRKLASSSNWTYSFSWRCRFCSKYPLGADLLSNDLRHAQEQAILEIAKASNCEAFHTAISVTIYTIENNEAQVTKVK